MPWLSLLPINLHTEAAARRCFAKKVELGNFARLTGKHLHRRIFLEAVAIQREHRHKMG